MQVNVPDAERRTFLQKRIAGRIGQSVSSARAAPLGRVELYAGNLVRPDEFVQIIEAGLPIPRIERTAHDETRRISLAHLMVSLGRIEAGAIELLQVGRLTDREVREALHEQVVVHRFRPGIIEALFLPAILCRPEPVKGIEAVDELLAMDVFDTTRRRIPEMDMRVEAASSPIAAAGSARHSSSAGATVRDPMCPPDTGHSSRGNRTLVNPESGRSFDRARPTKMLDISRNMPGCGVRPVSTITIQGRNSARNAATSSRGFVWHAALS